MKRLYDIVRYACTCVSCWPFGNIHTSYCSCYITSCVCVEEFVAATIYHPGLGLGRLYGGSHFAVNIAKAIPDLINVQETSGIICII